MSTAAPCEHIVGVYDKAGWTVTLTEVDEISARIRERNPYSPQTDHELVECDGVEFFTYCPNCGAKLEEA